MRFASVGVLALFVALVVGTSAHAPAVHAAGASEQAERSQGPGEKYYIVFSAGLAYPFGDLTNISGVVPITEINADKIYQTGLTLSLEFGSHFEWALVEGGILYRFLPLTAQAKEVTAVINPSGGEVSGEYYSFEVMIGSDFPLSRYIVPYAGVTNGFVIMRLTSDVDLDVKTDTGYGLAFETGADIYPRGPQTQWFIRAEARFQALALGLELPQDLMLELGVGYGF